jgi:hypothetical protein
MSVIPTPPVNTNFGDPPPKGTHLAVLVDVVTTYNDKVLKHGAPKGSTDEGDYKHVNRERFVFGVKTKDGKTYKIATRAFPISGYETSGMYKFLLSWLAEPPKPGFDTTTLIGKGAQITVGPNDKSGKTYMNIITISPVLDGDEDRIPPVSDFPKAKPVAADAQEADATEDIPF